MNKTQYDKLEMSWNVGWIGKENEEKALAAIEKYGGKELDGSTIGRATIKLVQFPDREHAHQCKLILENLDINTDYFTQLDVHLN